MFKPRPRQQEVINFTRGMMGVAAVPGSGKTQTLSFLAARLIREQFVDLSLGQEVLVVTLTNSAVGNFETRIGRFITDYGLMPRIGFRVRTLHGLAHDIVRERPDLVGLPTQFEIVDERESRLMLEQSVRDWLLRNPELADTYLKGEERSNQGAIRSWNELIADTCSAFIRLAKDEQVDAFEIEARMAALRYDHPLLRLGCEVYQDYMRKLAIRQGCDFDDLIRYALAALKTDPEFLARLRRRWSYVLEDEAQDSSRLQQQILELLTGHEQGNWIRVGDPNQAIFETFTTAHPELLREFIQRKDVRRADLPNSGRSGLPIIELANHLVHWTLHEHPIPELRDAVFETYIEPSPPDDPQPNPPDEECRIRIQSPATRRSSKQEINLVVGHIQSWMASAAASEQTFAVLTPTNKHGESLIKALGEANIPYVELLRNTSDTRQTASQLQAVLTALAEPTNPQRLHHVYLALRQPGTIQDDELRGTVNHVADLLRRCSRIEEYLYPLGGNDWLESLRRGESPLVLQELEWLASCLRRWQAAVLLPIDQLILTVANDLYSQAVSLALCHKLAQMLDYYARSHRDWSLGEFAAQLADIASSRRSFSGLSEGETGFDPDAHRGVVTVATMHKAKGLEWDVVYLLSVNNFDYPSLDPFDEYVSEKWFVAQQLNLQEELLGQLRAVLRQDDHLLAMPEGTASRLARAGIAKERIRLLYVGITRARKQLTILWNIGMREKCQPARALQALYAFLKEKNGHE